ncbi:hypothetical protein BJF93_04920 [Xaviernesmea oryzae]|uniref:AB hydrolase-1 domain-containing protein n=1 Tax=Xaviernesmea oryzae TaxID=464029 RepID=A0A1Q9AVB4_9HYPH|nr:hypothetical protein BJF93_04920 [Xaviernesmea oryzae]
MIQVFSILLTPLIASPAQAYEAGTRWITVVPAHRDQPENVLITYPALKDGTAYTLGADELWTGVPARREATPVAEKFPLVILSHGSGGNAASLGWLSTALARNGFIVAAPNHLHSTSGDSIPVESIEVWERAKDISALIDRLAEDTSWNTLIDPDRIGVIGFSLGGTTAMLSAGARASLSDFAAYCASAEGKDGGCNWFMRGGVDLAKVDETAFNGSYRDGRIHALVAVDPGFAKAFQPESLKTLGIPTFFLNLGTGEAVEPGVRAETLARNVPGAGFAAIPKAIHFTFLGVCNPDGAEVLKRYGEDDPVCSDGGDVPRSELHRQILFTVTAFLRKTLLER